MAGELDPSVVKEMIAGNPRAFRQILDHHIGPLTHYVRRMMHGPNEAWEEAEDIVQETFVRLWERRESYNPDRAKLTTWLHRIAHNLCLDSLRRQRNHRDDHDEAVSDITTMNSTGAEAQLEQMDQAQLVRRALQTLPERQRSMIILCHYQELSHSDAAEITGLSVQAVTSLLARARRSLKQRLRRL